MDIQFTRRRPRWRVLRSNPIDRLEPPEDLFDALAFPLAHHVAGVARGAPIDRTRAVRAVLGHVQGHLEQPEDLDEVAAVIAFVRPSVTRPAVTRWPPSPARRPAQHIHWRASRSPRPPSHGDSL